MHSQQRSKLASPALILACALVIRVLLMLALGIPEPVEEADVGWAFGGEQASVARSLLRGDGLSDPFAQGTGPTAWCGVVYPVVLASVMWVFGMTGQALSFVVALINAVCSAGVAVGLLRLGEALGKSRHGLVAAWVWVLHPAAVYFPLSYVWDPALVALGITWFLVAVARAGGGPSAAQAARLGGALGALAMLNASVLALAPACCLFWVRGVGLRRAAGLGLAFLGGVLLLLSPLMIRNHFQLGTLKPKANLGVELMLGNNDQADGGFRPHLHPAHNAEERVAFQELGEAEYERRCRRIFAEWVRNHPSRFASLTVTRIQWFWLGFSPFEDVPLRGGQRRERDWQGWIKWVVYLFNGLLALAGLLTYSDRVGGRVLLGASMMLFPVAYYVAHFAERYRFQVEPLLVFFGVGFVLWLVARLRPSPLGGEE